MALKSTYTSEEKGAEIEEALDALDTLVDRLKVLYEQYFMGIQKQPPTHLHTTLERQLRELTQEQIRNTALRYRLATLQQKHGAYNTYWKRTLREIESGRYIRNLSRLRARVAKTGEEIPEEILAKMPKRMRDAIAHDRELALAKAEREGRLPVEPGSSPAIAPPTTETRRRLRPDTSSPAMVVSKPPPLDDMIEMSAVDETDADEREDTSRHQAPLSPAAAPGGGAPAPRAAASMPPSKPGRFDRHFLDDILGDDDIDAA
ncbi:MAG TPA: hypothetical protein VHE35_02810, partial [Kofleriaceae bacterium]|nr:hypothetical protein [Kofleriaceae bacterium]